jgi:site-specific DNA-methyltransferase (adenine-specific)
VNPTWTSDCGTVRLWLGDCLDVMATWPDGAVDAVVTDPPYFLPAAHYQTRKQQRRSFSDLGILEHWVRDFFESLDSVSSRKACVYCFCDGQSYPLFYWHAYAYHKSCKPLVWDKLVSINGYGWRHQHELILWCERSESRPIPTGDGDILRYRAVPVDDRSHPAEKPVELTLRLLDKSCGHVCDPAMGSGTTGVAAVRLGRSFWGVELDPGYFEIARKRIEAELKRFPLFEEPAKKQKELVV